MRRGKVEERDAKSQSELKLNFLINIFIDKARYKLYLMLKLTNYNLN